MKCKEDKASFGLAPSPTWSPQRMNSVSIPTCAPGSKVSKKSEKEGFTTTNLSLHSSPSNLCCLRKDCCECPLHTLSLVAAAQLPIMYGKKIRESLAASLRLEQSLLSETPPKIGKKYGNLQKKVSGLADCR